MPNALRANRAYASIYTFYYTFKTRVALKDVTSLYTCPRRNENSEYLFVPFFDLVSIEMAAATPTSPLGALIDAHGLPAGFRKEILGHALAAATAVRPEYSCCVGQARGAPHTWELGAAQIARSEAAVAARVDARRSGEFVCLVCDLSARIYGLPGPLEQLRVYARWQRAPGYCCYVGGDAVVAEAMQLHARTRKSAWLLAEEPPAFETEAVPVAPPPPLSALYDAALRMMVCCVVLAWLVW